MTVKKFIGLLFLVLANISVYSQSYWTRVTEIEAGLDLLTIQFTSAQTGYACGEYSNITRGAILRTTNGGYNWQTTKFNQFQITDLNFINDYTGYFTGWTGGNNNYIYKTTNAGINWFCTDSIPTSFFKIKFYDENIGMIASKYNTYHFTTDGGYNWSIQYNGNWHEPTKILCFDKDVWIVLDNVVGINKTTNRGVNWTHMNFDSIGKKCAAIDFLTDTIAYSYSFNKKVFKSNNSGNNWTQIGTVSTNYTQYYNDIIFLNSKTGYINYYAGVFKTTNGGYNWFNSVADSTTRFNALFFLNPDTGFVAGWKGLIYRTTTGGEKYNPPPIITPDKFKLYQNYPNPFNPITTIKFDVPISSSVKISVFDVSGRVLKTLVNDYFQAGTYSVEWNAAKNSSGVYFYKLIARDFTETKKMLIVR
ncbi:MAG: T9SS type A sorting domain-containing protein [Ignavibacteria bacterium]